MPQAAIDGLYILWDWVKYPVLSLAAGAVFLGSVFALVYTIGLYTLFAIPVAILLGVYVFAVKEATRKDRLRNRTGGLSG